MYVLKTSKKSRRLAVIVAVAAAVWIIFWLWHFSTFRLFFAWPTGGTWSNTIAWLEDALISSLVVWAFRNHLGLRLMKWWDELVDPREQERLEVHHEKVMESVAVKLDEHKEAIKDEIAVKLDEHKEAIVQTINGHLNGNGNGQT